ncbi:L-aminoadipate-semialdehyde dehydrogenase-phosphopantetheinyl transferase [Linum perenne]
MKKAAKRWIVDISEWNPSPADFSRAVAVLPRHEHSSIARFVKAEDRKRALVSRLLQYSLVNEVMGIGFDEIVIKRTLEGKPYLVSQEQECDRVQAGLPNFNFNVSHHGDYVAIASEPLCLVGVDIVSCTKPDGETIETFIQAFRSYFSRLEWDNVNNAASPDETLAKFYRIPMNLWLSVTVLVMNISNYCCNSSFSMFCRYWSLKEAYVKATGSGLSTGLDKVEFRHDNWTNITISIDGELDEEWRFQLHELPKRHWLSIARGHPKAAVESYKATMKGTVFSEEEFEESVQLPSVGIVALTVEQLISRVGKLFESDRLA